MIYQPVNVSPSNATIDASVANDFSWIFSGDKLARYRIDIYELNQTSTTYTSTVTPSSTVYGGDTITHSVPAGRLSNSNDYIWKITQYDDAPSMFVVTGTFVSASSSSSFTISTQMTTVQPGMSILWNNQYREISTYNSETGAVTLRSGFSSTPSSGATYSVYTPFVTTLNGFYIKARSAPVVNITPITSSSLDEGGNLKYRYYTFQGTYSQTQNVSIKYHHWTIYATEEPNVILADSGEVYNARLEFNFDGFVSGTEYTIQLHIQTQDNQDVTTTMQVRVLYNEPSLVDAPTALWNPEHNSIYIDCNIFKVSEPTVDGDYEFTDDGYLHITNGSITYEEISGLPLNLSEFTVMTEFYIDTAVGNMILNLLSQSETDQYYTCLESRYEPENHQPLGSWYMGHIIREAGNNNEYPLRSLKDFITGHLQNSPFITERYEYLWNDVLIWNLDGVQVYVMNEMTLDPDAKFKLLMSNEKLILQDSNGQRYEAGVNTLPMVFDKLRLYAGLYYNYLLVCNKALSDSEIDKFFSDDFEPSWTAFGDSVIFAPFFNDNLVSSNVDALTTSSIEYLQIYRQKRGDNRQYNIGSIELNQTYIEDFSVANDEVYTYYIIPISDTEMGISIATNSVYVRFDEWTVNPITLDDSSNSMTMFTTDATWKFGLNIDAGELTQNILKTKFEGLSRYPKFTVEQRNYISGSLTCYLAMITVNHLIGTPDIEVYPENSVYRDNNDIYYEPASMWREWCALVASGREVLIRDLKGHIYRAQIDESSADIEIYNQTSPTTISFSFTEVGNWESTSVYIKGQVERSDNQ